MIGEWWATILEIRRCLTDACGESSARAIEHFVPSSLAVHDPACYEALLSEFIPTLSNRIINAVKAAVSRDAGVEVRPSETLFECMMRVSSNKGGMSSIITA